MGNILHRSASGRGAVAAVCIGALILLAQLVVAQERQPEWIGLRAASDGERVVLSWVQPASWAWDLGARTGQTVISVDGEPALGEVGAQRVSLANTVQLLDSAGNATVINNGGHPDSHVPEDKRLMHHVITAAFVLISSIVFILAADVLAATALLVLAMAVGVMFEATLAQHTGVAWSFNLVLSAVATMGTSTLLFFLLFPINRLASRWGRATVITCLAAYLVQIAGLIWVLNFNSSGYDVFRPITFLMLVVQMAAAIGLVVVALVRTSPERRAARRTLAIVAIGSTVAVAPLCLFSLLPQLLLGHEIVPADTSVLTLGLMPASLGAAVLSRQFLGIQRLVRRGLVMLLVWTALLTLYTLLWQLPLLEASPQFAEIVLVMKLALVLATFPMLQSRISRIAERALFRDVYDYSATLRRVGNQIVHESGVDTIAQYTLRELGTTLDLTWAAIVLRGTETEPLLIFRWGSTPVTLTDEQAEQAIELAGPQTHGAETAHLTPLVAEGNRVGVLLVGSKRHDVDLLADDEALLHSLAPVVATALDHALLVRRLEAQVAVLAQRERDLAGLYARLMQVQEEERRKLALDLHDDPLQRAAMLHRRMQSVERQHPEFADAAVFRDAANQIEVALRAICSGLRPRMLDDLGLEAAADWLVRDLRARSDLEIELDVSTWNGEPFGRLDPGLEIGLFRVAQEALNNAVKHAEANQVVVVLMRDSDTICLRVIDDGQGLGHGGSAASLGLLGMRERLAAWNASVSIDNGPYGGVVVSADVPLAAQPSVDRAA